MTRALLAVVVAGSLSGCTFAGGITGGTVASRRHERERPTGSTSIMPGVVTGAAIGMFLDALAIGFLIRRD